MRAFAVERNKNDQLISRSISWVCMYVLIETSWSWNDQFLINKTQISIICIAKLPLLAYIFPIKNNSTMIEKDLQKYEFYCSSDIELSSLSFLKVSNWGISRNVNVLQRQCVLVKGKVNILSQPFSILIYEPSIFLDQLALISILLYWDQSPSDRYRYWVFCEKWEGVP